MALGQSPVAPTSHNAHILRVIPPRKPAPVYEAVPQESEPTAGELPWRPFYLRRRVLGGFIAVLVAIIVAIESLFAVSERNQGLATSHSSLYYLWTYGPTAVLTLVAASWARVNFQAKLAAPWMRMSKGPSDAEETLLLDYTAMLAPVAVVKAVRHRDFLVAATIVIDWIFSVLIVLSTSLITLSLTAVVDSKAPLTFESAFVNDPAGLASATTNSLVYYNMRGLVNNNLTNPDGTSADFAYQTIATNLSTTAEIQTTVDGLSGGLDCEPASLGPISLFNIIDISPELNMTVTAPGCAINLTAGYAPYENSSYMSRFMSGSCGGSAEKANQRIVLLFGFLEVGDKVLNKTVPNQDQYGPYFKDATMENSVQLICKPTYNVSNVDLVKNGSATQSVTLSQNPSPRHLSNVDPWDIAAAHFESYLNPAMVMGSQSVIVSGETVNTDSYTTFAFGSQKTQPEKVTQLFQSDIFESYMDRYYRKYVALLVHGLLMEKTSTPSTGTATMLENRLLVRVLAAQLMTGLLGMAALLAVYACIISPRKGFLPRNPSTLLGQASLVSNSSGLLQLLQNLGGAEQAAVAKAMAGQEYFTGLATSGWTKKSCFAVVSIQSSPHRLFEPHTAPVHARHVQPLPVRPVSKLIYILIAGVIVTLEALFRVSENNSGLADVGNDTYLHYLWTVVPTAIMSLLAMYLASVDFSIRSLVPYAFLQKGAPLSRSLSLNLLDRSVPRALFEELRVGAYAAFAGTMTLLIAWFLSIFTSSLFLSVSVQQASSTRLFAETSFLANPDRTSTLSELTSAGIISSLVLESNLSYPAFTYEDLAMPGLSLPPDFVANNETDASQPSTLSFEATIPALRSKLSCRVYDSSHITTAFTYQEKLANNTLSFTIDGEPCRFSNENLKQYDNIHFSAGPPTPNEAYYGLADSSGPGSINVQGCSQLLYVWGRFNLQSNPNITAVSAMGCNETIETVDVAARFSGADLAIDTTNPPVPIESSARASTASVDADLELYLELATINTGSNVLDPFFAMLTSSPHAIPVEALSDPRRAHDVAGAIQFQHRVMRSMTTSSTFRVPANETNATVSAHPHAGETDAGSYYAKVVDPSGRQRVVQDAVSTRILEALLGAILVFSIVSWVLMPHTALLPRMPGSIAGAVALFAGGNMFECLPSGAEWWSDAELEGHFKELGINLFCLGETTLEGGPASDGQARFMICGLQSNTKLMEREWRSSC